MFVCFFNNSLFLSTFFRLKIFRFFSNHRNLVEMHCLEAVVEIARNLAGHGGKHCHPFTFFVEEKKILFSVPDETEETKGLDNSGLFSAQQQIVKREGEKNEATHLLNPFSTEQDEHLDVLADSIRRTKQM